MFQPDRRPRRALAAALLATTAFGTAGLGTAATAADFGTGYSLEGRVEYEWLANRDHNSGLAYGNVTLGFMPIGSPFGFEIGFEGYQGNDGDIAGYAAAKLNMGIGTLSVGIPRSAMDTFLDIPALGGSRYVDLTAGALTRGYVGTAYLFGTDTPYGLRYDADFGVVQLAASAHQFEGDGTVVDGTINVQAGLLTLSAGAENVDRRGNSGINTIVGAKAGLGAFEGGLYYSDVQRPGDMHGWTGYGSWKPSDPITLTASAIATREAGEATTLYGLSGEYALWESAYVQGGYLDGDHTNATYDLSIGWKF